MAKAKRINWKQRAADAEEALLIAEETRLAVHKHLQNVAFALEKEKALHRRTCEQNLTLNARLGRALTLIYGAAENLAGHGQHASADVLQMVAKDLQPPPMRHDTDGCAQGINPKDEQH